MTNAGDIRARLGLRPVINVSGTMTSLPSNMQYFNTPIDANGKIVVGINGQVVVFSP